MAVLHVLARVLLSHEDANTVCFVRSAHGRSFVRKCQKLEEFAICTLLEQEEIETVAKNRKYAGAFRLVKPGHGGL